MLHPSLRWTLFALAVALLAAIFSIGRVRAEPSQSETRLAALGLPGPMLAQSAQPSAPNQPPQQRAAVTPGDSAHVKAVEARIIDLHRRLRITAAEEAQWTEVARIMRENAAALGAVMDARVHGANHMSAIDDLRSYQQFAEVQDTGMQKLIPAFQSLYEAMPEAQQKNADTVFRTYQRRPPPQKKKTS